MGAMRSLHSRGWAKKGRHFSGRPATTRITSDNSRLNARKSQRSSQARVSSGARSKVSISRTARPRAPRSWHRARPRSACRWACCSGVSGPVNTAPTCQISWPAMEEIPAPVKTLLWPKSTPGAGPLATRSASDGRRPIRAAQAQTWGVRLSPRYPQTSLTTLSTSPARPLRSRSKSSRTTGTPCSRQSWNSRQMNQVLPFSPPSRTSKICLSLSPRSIR